MKNFIITTALIANTLFCTFQDNTTKETLTGVKVKYGDKTIYSDFDGRVELKLNSQDTIKIEFISYQDTVLVKNELLSLK